MGILRFFRRIIGRKQYFAPVFAQQATFLVQASRALSRMVETDDETQWRIAEKEVKACEIQGDALLTEFYEQLYENIMSPTKRSDMQILAMKMDDFLDHINDCAKCVLLYRPKRIDQQISDLAQYLSAEAESIRAMMPLMENMRVNYSQIVLLCDRITELEHASDDTFAEYIGHIFTSEPDAIEVIKYKNIAESFEAATDAAKVVSDNVRKILLKYVE